MYNCRVIFNVSKLNIVIALDISLSDSLFSNKKMDYNGTSK